MTPSLQLDLSSTKSNNTTTTPFLIDPLSPPLTSSNNENNNPFASKINLNLIRNSNINPNGLASKLRKATSEVHAQVMQPLIVTQLMTGQLPSHLYLRYLMMLHEVYIILENSLANYTTHPYLAPISNPILLNRSEKLFSDCNYFAAGDGDNSVDWKRDSFVWKELESEGVEELRNYLERLRELGGGDGQEEEEEEGKGKGRRESKLLAHAYVRYLGDLSGGQQIARSIRKSYSLSSLSPSSPTSSSEEGSSFYNFYIPPFGLPYLPSPSPLSKQATPSEVKLIKEWFREGLDSIGESMTEQERQEVIEEAKVAYGFNLGLFKSFERVLEREREKGLREEDEKRELLLLQRRRKIETGNGVEWVGKKTSGGTWCAVMLALGLGGWILVREWSDSIPSL